MINFNGNLIGNQYISIDNRGYTYGDALFETIKCIEGKILFWEDHYFRLMASMRIMRMEIPMNFTMEFLEEEIIKVLKANKLIDKTSRVKLTVHRVEGGLYQPTSNEVEFIIKVSPIESVQYILSDKKYEVDLYKDYYLSNSLLSTLKTNNKALNVLGSIFASENQLDNCLILNTDKQVVEALNGNVFVLKDHVVKTPPLSDGCLKGVMRKQMIEIIKKIPEYEVIESSVSPFELQKADEIFITNVIVGVQPITKYRKKLFGNLLAKNLISKLNEKITKD